MVTLDDWDPHKLDTGTLVNPTLLDQSPVGGADPKVGQRLWIAMLKTHETLTKQHVERENLH